ncbi:MAG: HD domain-containing protein [Thermoplasmata archaeon]|nr:MAG: HD domain-containing protein [Thermoplasmata archaeon]
MNERAQTQLFFRVGKLKRLLRSGWLRHKIPEPESVADHSFRTVFMAMVLGDTLDVDSSKLIRMAVVHDLAEVMAGDITPHDGITREEKREKEEEGLRELLLDISNKEQILNLWMEYEKGESKEAKILREIDKLEMAITAVEYQKMSPEKDLYEFIKEADLKIKTPEIRLILKEMKTINAL